MIDRPHALSLRPLRRLITGLVLYTPMAGALSAQSAQSEAGRGGPERRAVLKRARDSIVTAEMALRQWPSVAVMMVRGRDTILAKGYGKADIELDVPARVDGGSYHLLLPRTAGTP